MPRLKLDAREEKQDEASRHELKKAPKSEAGEAHEGELRCELRKDEKSSAGTTCNHGKRCNRIRESTS